MCHIRIIISSNIDLAITFKWLTDKAWATLNNCTHCVLFAAGVVHNPDHDLDDDDNYDVDDGDGDDGCAISTQKILTMMLMMT